MTFNKKHISTILDSSSLYISQKCPISGTTFEAGQKVVICKLSNNTPISLEAWKEYQPDCPMCNEQIVKLTNSLPLSGSQTGKSKTPISSYDNQPNSQRRSGIGGFMMAGVGVFVVCICLFLGIGLLSNDSQQSQNLTTISPKLNVNSPTSILPAKTHSVNPTAPPKRSTSTPKPTRTPTHKPISTSTATPNKSNLPELVSGNCPPNKCHIQGFEGGLLISTHNTTFALFNNSKIWRSEYISDQEALATEHFKCSTKSDLDSRVKWGFNVAYCRFHKRGLKLGNPIDEGGSIQGNTFQATPRGIIVDPKRWYGLKKLIIKENGTWDFFN